MRSVSVLSCALLFLLSGCGTQTEKAPVVAKIVLGPVKSKLDSARTQKLISVLDNYYAVKNSLVLSNAAKTEETSGQLAIAADEFRSSLSKDSANLPNVQLYLDTIILQSKLVKETKDPTCERQRLAFSKLSDAMFILMKRVELKNAGIYQQYCPMAFNEKGAYWLSNEADIKNPYYGKKMLECGEVKDSL